MTPAIVRTAAGYLMGFIILMLARWGIDFEPSAEFTGALTVIVGTVYYGLVRLVAKKWPALEALLGSKKTPSY